MTIEKIRPPLSLDDPRIEQLKQLFPEAFADGEPRPEVLLELLGSADEGSDTPEHFGLNWPGKRIARGFASFPFTGALHPCPEKSLDPSTSHHFFIEGENLEVLKILSKSYSGQINLIYIDPPYNTGNDFIYDDDYSEPLDTYLKRTGAMSDNGLILTTNKRASGRFHSKWLSMMYPRLLISAKLLARDGIIVIHIDEHEVSSLSLLLHEVFGEENFLGQIIWDKKNPKGDATGIAYQHETIIVYSKDRQYLLERRNIQRPKKNAPIIIKKAHELFKSLGKEALPNDLLICAKKYSLPSEITNSHKFTLTLDYINDEFSSWIKLQGFSGGEEAYSAIDENGEVYQSVSMAWPNKKKAPADYFIPLIHPVTGLPCPIPERGWRNPPDTMRLLAEAGLIIFGIDETTQPRRKYLLSENMKENIPSVVSFGGSDDTLLKDLGIPFDNPKPVDFVKQLIQSFSEDDDIVLDFFAGSCTTAHAVLDLNQQGANRKFIMVQFPEPVEDAGDFVTIADIGCERIRRVIKNMNQSSKEGISFGFKYLRLETSFFIHWKPFLNQDLQQLEAQLYQAQTPLKPGWKHEDLLTEILLLEGFPLDSRQRPLPNISHNQIIEVSSDTCAHVLYVCLDSSIRPPSLMTLKVQPHDIFICLDSALSDDEKIQLNDICKLKVI